MSREPTELPHNLGIGLTIQLGTCSSVFILFLWNILFYSFAEILEATKINKSDEDPFGVATLQHQNAKPLKINDLAS